MTLSSSQKDVVSRFLREQEMPDLYRSYTWGGDTWERGFPDLFSLERDISRAAREYSLNQAHLLRIARWGRLRNQNRISCPNPIRITLYVDGMPAYWLKREPENAICILGCQVRGFGPTYCSKILHFAVPQIFGALDTRLVRTFGMTDDLNDPQYQLLDLHASRSSDRWTINPRQEGWPREYGTWVEILNLIAQTLNGAGTQCPHPSLYVQSGLREEGVWLPADVETALFSYASQQIEEVKKK